MSTKPSTKYEVEITRNYKGEKESFTDTFYANNLSELEDKVNQHYYNNTGFKVIDETPNEPEFREGAD